MTLNNLPQIDKMGDEDTRSALQNILENAMGNPINFSSTPTVAVMKPNTWGFNGNDIYIKKSDGTGIKLSGAAMS